MSFYGSRYYQATDAFAKFLIKNSGLNKTDFLTETPPSSVEIEADGRTSELNLDSGNRWIQLKGSDEENKCTIYHEKANFNTDTFINIINNIEKPEENDDKESIVYPNKETILNVEEGVRFSIPLIYYDEAGHISMPIKEDGSVSQLIQTFVIPKIQSATEIDVVKNQLKDIRDVLGIDAEGNILVDAKGSLSHRLAEAEKSKEKIDTFLDGEDSTWNSFLNNYNIWQSSFNEEWGNFKADYNQTNTLVLAHQNDINDLRQRISALEK